jgi:mannose-1-phosphate guanylyltransferase
MMTDDLCALIMAGGGGTRLWPLSRRTRPKQMLRLIGDRTLFQMTVDRLLPMLPLEQIIVVTVDEQLALLKEQAPELPDSNFVVEPEGKGTASVIGLGATILQERYGNCVMACLPADHYIEDADRFRNALLAAYEAAKNDHLVTLGISPSHPATGYGYIQQGELIGTYQGFKVHEVLKFVEKPTLPKAEEYLSSGEFNWNSGMFIWKVERILGEIGRQMKSLSNGLGRISQSLGTADEEKTLESVWSGLETQTIDYGIMEGAERVAVVAADGLGWFDIGGWSGLWDVLPEDEDGNILMAENVVSINSQGSLVLQESEEDGDRLIALVGASNMIVVDTGDAVLVCPREHAEDIRRLVERLDSEGHVDFL